MQDTRNHEFLRMLGAKGTLEILEFLDGKKEVQHGQMREIIYTHTLNIRIRELVEFGLIQHHLEKLEKRREWYTLTEKGKKVLEVLNILISLAGLSTEKDLQQSRIDQKIIPDKSD